MSANKKFKPNELPWGLEISQFAYLILSLFSTLIFIGGLIFLDQIELKLIWMGVIACIFWILFYGTWKIKKWVVTPILMFSSVTLIPNLINILTSRPEAKWELFEKSISLGFTIFLLFQLYIFTRPKTKEYFKEQGTTLVS